MTKKVKSLEDIAELDIITTEDEQNFKEYKEEKEEIDCTEIVKKIQEVCEKLCVIDNYFDSLNDEQSKVDEELSDLCHYIENNDLKPTQCTKIVKAIKDVTNNLTAYNKPLIEFSKLNLIESENSILLIKIIPEQIIGMNKSFLIFRKSTLPIKNKIHPSKK